MRVKGCNGTAAAGSHRASESWRTYSEALYSGALDDATVGEIYDYHRTARAEGANAVGHMASLMKIGVLAGCGGDVSCGEHLETFTLFGFGYGLLQADLAEAFLLQYFAVAMHAYTRGTWIAPESSQLDRNQSSPPFCAPAGLVAPVYLRWLLVWEHPRTRDLWLGRAVPRTWLADGEDISVDGAPTRRGRVSLRVAARGHALRANLTFWDFRQDAPGAVHLRLRAPCRLEAATVGGAPWPVVPEHQTLTFQPRDLATPELRRRLQAVAVSCRPALVV